MSFIIDQTENFFFNFRERRSKKAWNSEKTDFVDVTRELKHLGDTLKGFEKEGNELISSTVDQNSVTLNFFLCRIHKSISAILSLKINVKTQQITFNLKLLNQNTNYLRIEGRERIRLLCKYLNSRFYQYLITEFNLAINTRNGEVSIKIPAFYFLSHFETQKLLERLFKSIRFNLVSSIEGFYNTLEMVSEVSNDKFISLSQSQKGQLARENFNKYYKYSKIVNMFLYICSESTHEEQFLLNQIQKEMNSIQSLKQSYIPFQKEFLSAFLYMQCQGDHFSKECPELQIHGSEKEKIKSRIEMPSIQKSNNPNENCYILNYIKTRNKLNKCLIKKICSGGFTSIYLAEIEYWYVASYNLGISNELEGSSSQDPHKKYVIIKREDKKMLQEGSKSRIAHERFILTRIKNGISIFLNKYYLLAEKDNNFENDLLSDFIDYPNLYDYCHKNKETMSFQTKLYLCIMVAQSLRYLSEYKIAHLDLKPTNIMTNRKLTIKLIDFGESYHPELKNHQPGFSMPYSAPENYKLPESYSYKNDVFSLGVIMHEMFMGKYPFYFHDEGFRDTVYRRRSYCDYWFHSSEGNSLNGQSVVFPLLQALIVKCLHPEPEHRPELEWIVYILRGCLDYFY